MNKLEGLYKIRSGDATATVSALGGTAATYIIGGQDFFYPWQMIKDKYRGGCPPCVPWFSSSPRGAKKHGFLRDTNAYDGSIGEKSVRLYFRGERPSYPWLLEYETRSCLQKNGALEMILRITRGKDGIDEDAPVNPGFHPFFACEEASKVEVIVGSKKFRGFSEESKMVPLESEDVLICIPDERIIRMRLGGDFFRYGRPQLVFWTDAPDRYACVEPIFQPYDWFDTPRGFYLEQNQGIKLLVTFEIM